MFLITTEEESAIADEDETAMNVREEAVRYCKKYSDQTWTPTNMATVEEYWDMYPKVVAEVRQW